MLDGDQMISIFTYVVLKSNFQELPCHIKMVEEFTSPEIQNGRLGQALFTVKAATENIGKGIISRRLSSIGL